MIASATASLVEESLVYDVIAVDRNQNVSTPTRIYKSDGKENLIKNTK